jgi:uncharacterized protein YrrD
MLWDASAILGYSIEASDGSLGTVNDFLFSDDSWRIRWLVVDTGNWLSGRKVLLHPSALGQPDPALRQFPVNLTKRQVKGSPDISTDQPVSRQMESYLYDYYGWDPYWTSSHFGTGAIATPFVLPLYQAETELRDPGIVDLQSKDDDPHLRSIEAVIGYHVHAIDGEIGHVEDLIIEDAGWSVRYIKVDTRNQWPENRVLISPRSIRKIDWKARLVYLDVNRQKVQNSPSYDPSPTVDGAYDETFLTYYGIRWVQP